VLEGKHVIGLFLIMLLFSGLFFTLGYVMGRNQFDNPVRVAASSKFSRPEPAVLPKADPAPKKAPAIFPNESASDPATSSNSEWEFYSNNKPAKSEPRLEPAPKAPAVPPASTPVSSKTVVAPAATPTKTIVSTTSAPSIPGGGLMLQVAACLRQDDATAIASSLQKNHYAVVVLNPQKDKYYRVQVGPLKDQKTAEATKKGLESAGFNAFYVKR
jgi:cell division septation protein DedD